MSYLGICHFVDAREDWESVFLIALQMTNERGHFLGSVQCPSFWNSPSEATQPVEGGGLWSGAAEKSCIWGIPSLPPLHTWTLQSSTQPPGMKCDHHPPLHTEESQVTALRTLPWGSSGNPASSSVGGVLFTVKARWKQNQRRCNWQRTTFLFLDYRLWVSRIWEIIK